jgi:hypothetical protein
MWQFGIGKQWKKVRKCKNKEELKLEDSIGVEE